LGSWAKAFHKRMIYCEVDGSFQNSIKLNSPRARAKDTKSITSDIWEKKLLIPSDAATAMATKTANRSRLRREDAWKHMEKQELAKNNINNKVFAFIKQDYLHLPFVSYIKKWRRARVKELCNYYVDVFKATGHSTSRHLRKQALQNPVEGVHIYTWRPSIHHLWREVYWPLAYFATRKTAQYGTLIFTLKPAMVQDEPERDFTNESDTRTHNNFRCDGLTHI
jgi:hypothetical protein